MGAQFAVQQDVMTEPRYNFVLFPARKLLDSGSSWVYPDYGTLEQGKGYEPGIEASPFGGMHVSVVRSLERLQQIRGCRARQGDPARNAAPHQEYARHVHKKGGADSFREP